MNLNNDIKKILVTEEQIKARCKELGEEINKDYADKKPILYLFFAEVFHL